MKVLNTSSIDIEEAQVVAGKPVPLKAGETIEVPVAIGKAMMRTWEFLKMVEDGEPKVEAPKAEPKVEKPVAKPGPVVAPKVEPKVDHPKKHIFGKK